MTGCWTWPAGSGNAAIPAALAGYAALDADLTELARRHDQGATRTVMEWEYLLLTARKRS